MVSQVSIPLVLGAQHVQPKASQHVKVILSAEAHTILKLNQREKAKQFREDLHDVCRSLDKITKTLASKHHRSVRRVRNDLHLGTTKLRFRRGKINAWNTFCWKKRRGDRTTSELDESGMFFFLFQSMGATYLIALQWPVARVCCLHWSSIIVQNTFNFRQRIRKTSSKNLENLECRRLSEFVSQHNQRSMMSHTR